MSNQSKKNTHGKVINRRTATERDNSDFLLGDFNVETSKGLQFLKMINEDNLTKESIQGICEFFSKLTGQPVLRDYKRRKALLIKWIDENYDNCLHYAKYLVFECTPL